ncbi:outer membrane porin putative [Vibrio variabilis]|uniref:Outer membrane porin putative n=1 Tax=Vibrio variabilis TaxID=990271 RepID=A0ABQ0JCW0_9VIBR|nr:outer membrane porin putative [Vibrio variabilis]
MKKSLLSALVVTALTSASAMAAHTFVNDAGDSLTIDGRFDLRYQDKGEGHNGEWNSGSSRFGLKGVMGLDNGWTGFGHAEWGYNSGANGNNIYDRLLYAGVEHEKYGKIAAGTKQWSTFYDVAWYTDLGRVFGTRGSGAYNLSDWGIASGTGRAENSITYRNSINEDLSYGFTYQTTREDVALSGSDRTGGLGIIDRDNRATATLKNGMGASLTYRGIEGVTLGAAYHQNELDEVTSNVQGAESGDHMRIMLLGANYTSGGFYAGATFQVGENWESVETSHDSNILMDTIGGEVYTYYQFENGLRPTFIYNYLTDRGNDANGFERQLIVPGLEYHFQTNKFLVWTEYQFDLGKDKLVGSSFENREDQFAAGIRYYF